MKKMRYLIAALLTAAMLMALVACGGTGDGGDTGDAGDAGEVPAWPDATPATPTVWPEPTGNVTYTKIKVTPDMVTSSTPWNNGSDVATNAFDGRVDTFFDGIENGWITVDLGEPTLIGELGFAPRSGYEARLNGAFYGSVDGVKWTKIYQIKVAPQSMKRVKYEEFSVVGAFRFIKYENTRECANIAEFEIYSATNIPPSVIKEPDRETFADGSYVDYADLGAVPENNGMKKLSVTSSDAALVDNNPSTLATAASTLTVELGGKYTVGAITYISDSSAVGGKFYGVREDGSRDLLWEVKDAPTARKTEAVLLGKLITTGSYTSVVFEKSGKYNMAEIAVYSADMDTDLPLTALPFAMDKKGDVDCVALNWGSPAINADTYEIYRKRENGEFKLVYTGSGTSWQDYGLPLGNYTYQVRMKYGDTSISSDPVVAECREMPSDIDLYTINNQTGQSLHSQSTIYDGEYYYSYSLSGGAAMLTERRSNDGYNFNRSDVKLLPTAHPLMGSCKIESVKVAYIPSKNRVIVAAHWEKPNGYADGKLFLATGEPGGEFTVNIFNPLGIQVRDMSIFVDDDDTAYLLAAANVPGQGANATTYIFKFNDDYTDIKEITVKLFEDMYREMPNIVKIDGWYYLFVSQTSGWAPSAGAYAVSRDISDPKSWSDLRWIGNSSTFGSQSSWIFEVGQGDSKNYIMHAYRWGPAQGTGVSGTMLAPIMFSNGVAYYDYFPEILYNDVTGDMIPVTYGMLLSQDANVTANKPHTADGDPSNIVDGDYNTAYVANGATWPTSVQIDLGRECDLTNIQLSWYIMKGSEAFYLYKVSGSNDGKTWTVLRDSTKLNDTVTTKAVGFSSHMIKGTYRYIKIDVNEPRRWKDSSWDATSVYGESLTWYTPTIYEVKVYGTDPSYTNDAINDPVGTPAVDTGSVEDSDTGDVGGGESGGCSSTLGSAAAIIAITAVFGCAVIKKKD